MIWWWWIIPGVVAVLGLAVALSGLGWMFRGKPLKGGRGVFGGGLFLAGGAVVSLMGLNVQSYQRLTAEREVASIEMHQKGPQQFEVTVTQPALPDKPAEVRTFNIRGDEWRLEARVIKWKPWANVLGLDSQYRLDRFSGRYKETTDEQTLPHDAYDLRPAPNTGLDFLPAAQTLSHYLPIVDIPQFGEGVYMPMADGAKYNVTILASGGLLPRPDNEAASEAVANWHN